MSLDAAVAIELVEDPTLTVPMKLKPQGNLYVKGQFIEETRSYNAMPSTVKMALTKDGDFYTRFFIELGMPEMPIPPIPPPIDSMSFDTFDYYPPNVLITGLNSGSNEWNNKSPYAAYYGKENFAAIQNTDKFELYVENTIISTSMAGTGSGTWSSSLYDYAGREVVHGIMVADYFNRGYTIGAEVTASDTGWTSSIIWIGSWEARTNDIGIKAYDDFTAYNIGDFVSGSNANPNFRYPYFTGPWDARTYSGI